MEIIDGKFDCRIDRATGIEIVEGIVDSLRNDQPSPEAFLALIKAMDIALGFTEHRP
jgi:hypothetical protein